MKKIGNAKEIKDYYKATTIAHVCVAVFLIFVILSCLSVIEGVAAIIAMIASAIASVVSIFISHKTFKIICP